MTFSSHKSQLISVFFLNVHWLQENDEEEEEGIGAEEEPLCSDDDVSDEENQNDLFDTENVVVCQYDKVIKFDQVSVIDHGRPLTE